MSKGRHLEVTYAIRVAVAATLGPEISIDLPVNIVNFVSLDPPPGHLATSQAEEELMRRTKSNSSDSYNLQDINNFVMPRDATIRHPPPQHRASHSLTGPAISSSAYRAGGGSRLAPLESVEEKSELERSLRGSEEGGHSEGTLEASQPSDKEDLALDVWRYDEADDEECSDSQDEIETVLSLERPLPLSPLFSGRPDSLGLQRDAGFESPPSSPPRPQRAWSASDTGVRARLSPEACKRSAPMPQPVSPKRPARANLQNLSPQRRVSSSPRKSYAPVVEVSETDETPYPLASSMSATVRQRRPASTHLSPLQVNQGEMNQDSAGSSSPEPGLSPSIGASSPSTVTALTPPLDCDSHDDVLMHMLGSNSTSPVFAPTPKNMLKPWSPVVGKAAKSPGSSVRSRVAALESMSPELAMEQGRKPSSLYSVTSEATSLKRIVRAQSESSLKAP